MKVYRIIVKTGAFIVKTTTSISLSSKICKVLERSGAVFVIRGYCSTILLLSSLMFSILIVRRFITGEMNYLFEFSTIQDSSYTTFATEKGRLISKKILNNVTEMYKAKLDPYKYWCNSKGSCKHFEMLFIVKSFSGNFERRTAIRNTWGKSTHINMKTIFVLGTTSKLQSLVDYEARVFEDILQFDISDSYKNLVYKTILSMTWITNCGVSARFVHFIDDDRLVNTNNVYKTAMDNISLGQKAMIGYKLYVSKAYRQRTKKCQISIDEYGFDYWPPYLIGGTILTNIHVVNIISRCVPYMKIIHMEDTFIGIIAKLTNINVIHHSGFLPVYKTGLELRRKLSSPGYDDYNELIKGWKQLNIRLTK